VLVDIDPRTFTMDPAALEAAITPRTKAIMPVHLYGQCADMDPILEICARYDITVVEDAAEAVGGTYKSRPAGTLAPIGAYSFNGNKIITTTGGGMLTAHNPAAVEKARFWSQQARDPGVAYEHTEMGYNYRLSNVLAALPLLLPVALSAQTALTIYNQNFAVVRELVPLDLKVGVNLVNFSGATTQVEADSVVLRDVTGKVALRILEQSYRADAASEGLLLSLNEGKILDFLSIMPHFLKWKQ
jgi:hypothetical protein